MKRYGTLSTLCFLLSIFLLAAISSAQQDKSKRPSPPATANVDLGGGTTITIDYSSPRAKGRKIFGDVVPYGQIWRTGANEATTFVTTGTVMVGNITVPAGSYTLFTQPDKSEWVLVLSKKTGEWGTDYPGKDNDLGRTGMTIATLPTAVENFTISFDKKGNGATLNIDWETTRASVMITKK